MKSAFWTRLEFLLRSHYLEKGRSFHRNISKWFMKENVGDLGRRIEIYNEYLKKIEILQMRIQIVEKKLGEKAELSLPCWRARLMMVV